MKAFTIAVAGLLVLAPGALAPMAGRAASARQAGPRYTADGSLIAPPDYREWIFLSAGLDMSYTQTPHAGAHVFDNVFAPPAAYRAFRRDGVWPDKTVLILENRTGGSDISINRSGVVQTGAVAGMEAHVKDLRRFKGGWGFFRFAGQPTASLIPTTANCYECHQQHGAADTTFVQFYPTLLPFIKGEKPAR